MFYLLPLFSGAAALLYQLAWGRLLALSIGSTGTALAAILAAIFLGMAAGSFATRRWLERGGEVRRAFIACEALTACAALLLLPLLFGLDGLLAAVPQLGRVELVRFLLALLLLLLPSAAIGAVVPLLSNWQARRGQGDALGTVYALYSAGALAGVLLGGFVVIPWLGLSGAVVLAAAGNVIALLLAVRLPERIVVPYRTEGERLPDRAVALPLAVVTLNGFVALGAQVAWGKLLVLVTGSTLYGYTVLLAGVLLGITLGSFIYHMMAARRTPGVIGLRLWLLLLAALLLLTREAIAWLAGLQGQGLLEESVERFLAAAAVLLPVNIVFGLVLPYALALAYPRYARIGSGYGWNILAGVVGATAAGLWLIPSYGSDTTLRLLALLPLLPVLFWPRDSRVLAASAAMLAGLLVAAAVLRPPIDLGALVAAVDYRFSATPTGREPHYRYLAEGRSGVISLVDYSGDLVYLQKNGIKEAMLNSRDARKGTLAESLLAYLPSVFRPASRNAFVVGFGAGTTARLLALTELERLRVVELEPQVIEAMFSIGREKFDFLNDERLVLEYNDARNALLLTDERYDIIVSQPSHPWLAGSAALFSREFFQLGRERLAPGGVFGQWLNLFQMDTHTLKAVLRSFYRVFPRGAVFGIRDNGDLLLFGSEAPLVLDYQRSASLFDHPDIRAILNYGGIRDLMTLPHYFLFDRETVLASLGDGPEVTDNNLMIETRLARLTTPPVAAQNPYRFIAEVTQRQAAPAR